MTHRGPATIERSQYTSKDPFSLSRTKASAGRGESISYRQATEADRKHIINYTLQACDLKTLEALKKDPPIYDAATKFPSKIDIDSGASLPSSENGDHVLKDFGILAETEKSGECIAAAYVHYAVSGDAPPDYNAGKNVPEMFIAVKEGYRRQGIGEELMRRLIELGKALGCKKMWWTARQ